MFLSASSHVVKKTARTALKGNWLNAVLASTGVIIGAFLMEYAAYFFGTAFGESAGNILYGVLLVLLLAPLALGLIRYFWRMIFGVREHPVAVFHYFSSPAQYRRAMGLTVHLGLRLLLFGALLFLPVLAVDLLSGIRLYDFLHIPVPLWASNLSYLSVFFKTIATMALFFIMLRYYSAPVLAVADEDMEIAEVVHMSTVLARGTVLDFLFLLLSFLGWLLLSVFFAPLIFTLPYLIVAICVQVRFAVTEYNRRAELLYASSAPTFEARL